VNLYAYVRNDPINATDPSGRWFWAGAGAIINGGIQIHQELEAGTLDSWEGAGRVAVAAGTGAIGGGAVGTIGRQIVGRGAVAIARRAVANATVGAGTSAAQAEGNARIGSGGQQGASGEELRSRATQGAVFAGLGSVAGDAAGPIISRAAGGVGRDARVAAAESDRLIQGQGQPGGSDPGQYVPPRNPGPTASQIGAIGGEAVSTGVGAAQPSSPRSCPTGRRAC